MREVHGFRLIDHVWTEVPVADVAIAALPGDEGVLTGAICRWGTPLPVHGRTYHPLLFGYPDENGVDVLWLSDDGYLLMAECKKRCTNPAADVSQVCQHFVLHEARTLSSILALCQDRAQHQSANAVARLQQWFKTCADPEWSLGELADHGRLRVGIVYSGSLPPALDLPSGLPVVVASFQFNVGLDAYAVDAGTVGNDGAPDALRTAIAHSAKPHEARLQRNRESPKRVHRQVGPVVEFYLGLPDTMPAKRIVSELLEMGLSPAAGTGKSEPNSLRLRIPNGTNGLVPFIWFHDQAKLHVEPNIRSFCVDGRFATSHEEMGRIFDDLGRLPTAEPTGGGGWNFRVARFTPSDANRFLDLVKKVLRGSRGADTA